MMENRLDLQDGEFTMKNIIFKNIRKTYKKVNNYDLYNKYLYLI